MYKHAYIRVCMRAWVLQLFMLEIIKIQYMLAILQVLGQSLCFREQFDVAVARAVAEMRVLGNK